MNSKSWSGLIPEADLIAANARYEAQQLAERRLEVAARIAAHEQAASEKKAFVYRARSPEEWAARANQPTHRRWGMAHGHYILTQEERERLATKVQTLLGEYQAETTVKELSQASEMSESWVRKHLKFAGIQLKSQRQKRDV